MYSESIKERLLSESFNAQEQSRSMEMGPWLGQLHEMRKTKHYLQLTSRKQSRNQVPSFRAKTQMDQDTRQVRVLTSYIQVGQDKHNYSFSDTYENLINKIFIRRKKINQNQKNEFKIQAKSPCSKIFQQNCKQQPNLRFYEGIYRLKPAIQEHKRKEADKLKKAKQAFVRYMSPKYSARELEKELMIRQLKH